MLLEALKKFKNHSFFYTVSAFAFLLPLSRATLSLFALILPIMWIIDTVQKKSFRADINKLFTYKVVILLFAYFALMFVSLLWGQDNYNFWNTRIFMFSFLFFITPVVIMKIKKEETPTILSGFLLGMLISEIVSYGIFFEWWHYKNILPTDPSPFMKHIEYSVLLVFTSLLLLSRIMHAISKKEKVVYLLFFLTVTINLFINGGRTGQLAFFISIFIVLIYNTKYLLRSILVAGVISVLVAVLAWNFSSTFKDRLSIGFVEIEKALTKKDYTGGFGIRLGAYAMGWELFKEAPLLGYGWVGNQPMMRKIAQRDASLDPLIFYIDLQNQFLFIVAQFGLLGLILFLVLLFKLASLPIKSKHYRNVKIIFLSVLMVYFFSEAWIHQFIAAFSALIIGLLVVHSNEASSLPQ